MKEENSKPGEISKFDLKSIGRGALIAIAGALATYIAVQLSVIDWETMGKYGYILAPLASIVINFLRKWASDHSME